MPLPVSETPSAGILEWLFAILLMIILNISIHLLLGKYSWDTEQLYDRIQAIRRLQPDEGTDYWARSMLDDMELLERNWDVLYDSPYLVDGIGAQFYTVLSMRVRSMEHAIAYGNTLGGWSDWSFLHFHKLELHEILLSQINPTIWDWGLDILLW
jgi:hypothetical protein